MDLLIAVSLIVNAAFSGLVGWAAGERNRSPGGWFLISFFFTPILAAILLVAVGPGKGGASYSGNVPDYSRLTDADWQKIHRHRAEQKAEEWRRRNQPPPKA